MRRWSSANKSSLEQVHVYVGVPSIPMPHEIALRLLHPECDSGRRDELAFVPEHSARSRGWLTPFIPN